MAGEEAHAQQEQQEARIARLEGALAERDAKLAELTELVGKLTGQIEKLTEQLAQNSKNSHRPPSSDGPGSSSRSGKAGKRPGSGLKRGGQKGHRGSYRELVPAAHVDQFIELFPEVCLGCARCLPETPDAAACRYQQLDLREHRPHVVEFRRHEVQCERCGSWTRASYDRIPSSAFGPCLTAVVGLLTGAYHLSRRSAQKLLRELFGISISLGAISGMEGRASDALKLAYAEAEHEVQYARVKHADATSWTRAGKLMSLWTLASMAATFYRILPDGCRDTIRPLFGPTYGVLVSDRASVFTFWSMKCRQICFAHLLRRFVAFSERTGTAGALGREMLGYTALVFEYWHGYKTGLLNRQEFEFWLRPVQRGLEQALERGAKADIERLSGSCADMLAHSDALWTFVTLEGVPPTNNHAECELRGFVMWRKRSFGSQSDRGERFAERMMTVVHTARKQGKAVLDFLVQAVTAHIDGGHPPQLLGHAAG